MELISVTPESVCFYLAYDRVPLIWQVGGPNRCLMVPLISIANETTTTEQWLLLDRLHFTTTVFKLRDGLIKHN